MSDVIDKLLRDLDDDGRFEIEMYGTCVECGYDDAFATLERADKWYVWTRCDGCGRDDNEEIDVDEIEEYNDDDIRDVFLLDPDEEIFVN